MANITFKFDPTPEGYVHVHVGGASNYIPDKILMPGDSYKCELDVTKIVGTMTEREIIEKMVDVIRQFPTGIDELMGEDVYKALEDGGYLY